MARRRRQIFARPNVVRTFPEFIIATGGRPLLRLGDQRLLRGPFDVSCTLTDNAAVAESLTTQSKWDKRVQGMYGSSASTPVKGVLHLAGAQVYINDATYATEALSLQASLDDRIYLHTVRGGKTLDFPLRGHITQAISQFEFHEAANTALTRGLQLQPPLFFERPIRVDLETDVFTIQVDTAINWASYTGAAYIRLFGHIAPKDFPGAMGGDDVCTSPMDDPAASMGPIEYGDFAQITPPASQGYLAPGSWQ